MLYSQGVKLEDLGIPAPRRRRRSSRTRARSGTRSPRTITCFAARRRASGSTMRSTTVFGIDERLTAESADRYFDRINECLAQPAFRPRALVRALQHRSDRDHRVAARSARPSPEDPRVRMEGPRGHRVPAGPGRRSRVRRLRGQRRAIRCADRRGHGDVERLSRRTPQSPRVLQDRWARRPPTTATRPRARPTCGAPNASGCSIARCPATITAEEAEAFRGQMLTEMAKMSLDDGLVMQIHPGSFRNHNPLVFRDYGRDKGADIPTPHRLRARIEAAARPVRQRARLDHHPVHARRDDATRASWLRWRATIRC